MTHKALADQPLGLECAMAAGSHNRTRGSPPH